MKLFFRIIIALILGIVIGSAVNMSLIIAGSYIIEFPDNLDLTNAINLSSKYFVFPFLAHGIGTFSGAFSASKISKNYHIAIPLTIGLIFPCRGHIYG